MQIILRDFIVFTMRCFSDGKRWWSESSDFIEEDTEESSTEGSIFDYDTDSDIDLENSGYDIAINPVNLARPTDHADENDFDRT